ncbi:hypothetical protein BB560_005693 [Smittium megazygosporum]|uniref:SWIRM domain-containing protein n=1 Tax=Smittium megazygosporum TaxID=133381 RepID=A0A2T9Z1A2_9FUNG|nr:hypothetical protein BB560_005693 [Smittium megazygosporum]
MADKPNTEYKSDTESRPATLSKISLRLKSPRAGTKINLASTAQQLSGPNPEGYPAKPKDPSEIIHKPKLKRIKLIVRDPSSQNNKNTTIPANPTTSSTRKVSPSKIKFSSTTSTELQENETHTQSTVPVPPQFTPQNKDKRGTIKLSKISNTEAQNQLEKAPTAETKRDIPNYTDTELKAPENFAIDKNSISEFEKIAHIEFFSNRTNKTPERYMKIRNFILSKWEDSKPKYINKVASRKGLEGCGDVNAIGRVHTWLEKLNIINTGIEPYNRLISPRSSRSVKVEAEYEKPHIQPSKPQPFRAPRRKPSHNEGPKEPEPQVQTQNSTLRHHKKLKTTSTNQHSGEKQESFCFCDVLHNFKKYRVSSVVDPFKKIESTVKNWSCPKHEHSKTSDDTCITSIPVTEIGDSDRAPMKIKVDDSLVGFLKFHFAISGGKSYGSIGGKYDQKENLLYCTMAFPNLSSTPNSDDGSFNLSENVAINEFEQRGFDFVGYYGPINSEASEQLSEPVCEVSKLIILQEISKNNKSSFIKLGISYPGCLVLLEYVDIDDSNSNDMVHLLVQAIEPKKLLEFSDYYLKLLDLLFIKSGISTRSNSMPSIIEDQELEISNIIDKYFKGYTVHN